MKAHEVMRENKTEFPSLSVAFQYVLKEHRDLRSQDRLEALTHLPRRQNSR